MWAFDSFPARLRHSEENSGYARIYEVVVFGYVCNGYLVAFRNIWCDLTCAPPHEYTHLLPISEFEERYKKFKLVQGN